MQPRNVGGGSDRGSGVLNGVSAGEIAEDEQKTEDEWGFIWAASKLLRGRVKSRYQESWLRTISRVALLGMPGVSDHFPGDYARGLRLAIDDR